MSHHGTVTSHGVTSDGPLDRINWEQSLKEDGYGHNQFLLPLLSS